VALSAGGKRLDVRFPCGATQCAGWLFVPDDPTPDDPSPRPGVVMGHGFAGQRELGLAPFAEAFAAAGYVTLVFDYRGWGDSGGEPRYVVDMEAQIQDFGDALAWLRSHDTTDPHRVALWGTSLGGGHALMAAHRDGHVQAVLAQVPMVNGNKGGSAHPSFRDGVRLLRLAFLDKCRARRSEPRLYVPSMGSGLAFVVGPEAEAAAEALPPPDSTWPNLVAADILLDFDEYHPHRVAPEVTAPTQFVLADADRHVHNGATERVAQRMPAATVRRVEGGHFDVYSPPVRDEVIALQLAFLAETVGSEVSP